MLDPKKSEFLTNRAPHLAKLRYLIVGDGKSGTVTSWRSIMKGQAKNRLSLHAHGNEYLWSNRMPLLREPQVDLLDLVKFAGQSQNVKPLIIYTFREPIGRTISAFFQNFAIFCKDLSLEDKKSTTAVCACLLENLQSENYHACEISSQMGGLDCYAQPFDKARGWSTYETEFARLLFLKFERIENWSEGFKAALTAEEIVDFQWTPAHLTSEKPFYEFYQQVKNEFRPTREALDTKFATHDQFLNHFYTVDEIANLKKVWYGRCEEQV